MGLSKIRAYCSLPDMNKIRNTMETIFSREISYGAFLAEKGFMTKKLPVYMLKNSEIYENDVSDTLNLGISTLKFEGLTEIIVK